MSDETPLYILGVGDDTLGPEELDRICDAVSDALERTRDDGEVVIINRPVEAITRDDLKEMIGDE